jgi:hypothetical protein
MTAIPQDIEKSRMTDIDDASGTLITGIALAGAAGSEAPHKCTAIGEGQ